MLKPYYPKLSNRAKTVYLLAAQVEGKLLKVNFVYFSPFLTTDQELLSECGDRITIYLDEKYKNLKEDKITIPATLRIKKYVRKEREENSTF